MIGHITNAILTFEPLQIPSNLSGGPQFLLGNLKEPLMLHVHLICRGIIGKEYLPGLPLIGPRPGEVFDLRGNGSPTEGQKKLSWNPKERQLLQQWLQKKFQTLL